MNKKRASAYIIVTLIILAILTSQIVLTQKVNPETLVLTIYSDGFTSVDYELTINSTFPTHNITIFGQVLEDLIVVDSNGLPLGYSLNNSILSVFSLGANEIRITYNTQDLTTKEGRYWTVQVDAPINTRIILPEEAVIISLNNIPTIIETNDNKMTLLMDQGLIQVVYIVGIVGTKEYAQIVIDETEQTIIEIQNLEINVTEAETKLNQAKEAFYVGNYAEAETLGNEAKNRAIQINQTAFQAQFKITEAEGAIIKANNEQRTEGLDNAQNLLEQAKNSYNVGQYSEALSLATQALNNAQDAEIFNAEENDPQNFVLFQVFAVLAVLGILAFILLFMKSRKKIKTKKRQIDSERIFREHKELMPDEKQAILFLIDNNGEAFEAELYDHVKLPRTTTWRMVKRLKRMDIITVTKFRRQNLVRLKTKYDIRE